MLFEVADYIKQISKKVFCKKKYTPVSQTFSDQLELFYEDERGEVNGKFDNSLFGEFGVWKVRINCKYIGRLRSDLSPWPGLQRSPPFFCRSIARKVVRPGLSFQPGCPQVGR